jgi:hypothetical protein
MGGEIAREGPSLRTASATITTAAASVDTAADKNPQRTRDRLILKEITSDRTAPFRV